MTTNTIQHETRSHTARRLASTLIAGSAALLLASVASGQCGTGGLCSVTQTTPGCSDYACCQLVCASDPFCCLIQWDIQCVQEAAEFCVQSPFIAGPVLNPNNGHQYWITSANNRSSHQTLITSEGAAFVSIANGVENEWLRRAIFLGNGAANFTAYIGLNDIATEGSFAWADGAPVTYLNWAPGQPNNQGGEDATQMFAVGGAWNDIHTGSILPAVAEASISECGSGGSCFSEHNPGCDDETCCNQVCTYDLFCCESVWDAVCVNTALSFCKPEVISAPIVNPATGSRYFLASQATWLSAEKLALSLGGTLISIGNAAENEWMRLNFSTFSQVNAAWIGLHDQRYENSFEWTDTAPLTYSNWNAGEPNDALAVEDHAVMYFTSGPAGTWNDVPQSSEYFAIIEVPCTTDLDGSGSTDASDLAVLLGAWGSGGSVADLNLDSRVNAADLAILLGAWGPCPTSNACFARSSAGSDQPGCTACICQLDPFCCFQAWDGLCVDEAETVCFAACQCGS
jgi:Lectin C-type domain